MGIIRDALKKQICDNNRQQFNDATATILEYNMTLNVATIRFNNPNGEGTLYRENVPVSNTLGGVTGSGIFPGQTCSITFLNNNVYAPVITGLTGSNYSSKTCTDQGAYLVDIPVLSVEEPDKITPMINNWIEEGNTNTSKYNNDLGDYSSTDTAATMHEILNTLDKYKSTEQGITNLSTKSTTKLKENGDIDMFVANNIGIRISRQDKSITLYGKFKINGQEITKEFSGEINTDKTNSNIFDIIKISKLGEMIKDIDSMVEELELIIKLNGEITGNEHVFDSIKSQIKEFKSLRTKYYNISNDTTMDEINNLYDQLERINKSFSNELNQGQETLAELDMIEEV